jgi:hypothetical protein
MSAIEAFIISWTGQLEKAQHIASQIEAQGISATIVHSDSTEPSLQAGQGTKTVVVDNSWFFGLKFEQALRLSKKSPLLIIQADATASDWGAVATRFEDRLRDFPIGVWAPDVFHTSWVTSKVQIRQLDDPTLIQVSQTDGIVLGLSSEVAERMKGLDYDGNNLGWGIDWAAIIFAMTRNQLVVRDFSVRISHRKGSGYGQDQAALQQAGFLSQLSESEKALLELLRRSHALSKRLVQIALRVQVATERWIRKLARGKNAVVSFRKKPNPQTQLPNQR